MFTRDQWATDLLAALGNDIPLQTVLDFVIGWTVAETNTDSGAEFNLLNTTQPASDATDFNSVHVKNYTSYEEGIAETVTTLENGFYPALLQALKSNDVNALTGPNNAILSNLNTWCGGCNYGHGFITLGQAHRGDGFSYGSAPSTPIAPVPVQVATENQLKAAIDAWKSVFLTIGTPPPVTGTGIYESWLANLITGKQFGPPLTHEYDSEDWDGNHIVVQEFAHARCEWNGAPHWYGPNGKIA